MSTKLIKLTILFFSCLMNSMNASVLGYIHAELPKDGQEISMKARVILNAELAGGKVFAIFDGDENPDVANYAKGNLISSLEKNINFNTIDFADTPENFAKELQRGIVNFDRELLENGLGDRSGATLCVVYLKDNILWCANLGDSRAVLYSKKGEEAGVTTFPLSVDHKVLCDDKPVSVNEEKRIKSADGTVVDCGMHKCVATADKINTRKAVRALGNFLPGLKNHDILKSGDGSLFNHPIGNVPDVRCVELNKNNTFIVIASKGLWNCMQNEEVGRYVNNGFLLKEPLETITKGLMKYVASQNSVQDDISLIIIQLADDGTLPEAEEQKFSSFPGYIAPEKKA